MATGQPSSPEQPVDKGLVSIASLDLLENSALPMAVFDAASPRRPLIVANRPFLNILQRPLDQAIGVSAQTLLGHDLPGEELAELAQTAGSGCELVFDIQIPTPQGAYPARLALSPLMGPGGRGPRHLAILRTRTADAALAREAEHRGMNALALVQAVVRLSRGDPSAVRQRVDSLVRAHMLLADNAWRGASLSRIIEGELTAAPRERCSLYGDAAMVRGRCVQALALVIGELRRNAELHGALSTPAGRVRLSWKVEEEVLTITWRESGGPPPAAERPAGYGQTIMPALIERQLKGEASLDFAKEGFTGAFRVPAAVIEQA